MKKTQRFKNQHLSIDSMRKLDTYLTRHGGVLHRPDYSRLRLVYPDNACWDLDSSAHFLDRYDPSLRTCYEQARGDFNVIVVNYQGNAPETKLIVVAPDQKTIDSIFDAMERYLAESVSLRGTQPGGKRFCRTGNRRGRKGREQTEGHPRHAGTYGRQ